MELERLNVASVACRRYRDWRSFFLAAHTIIEVVTVSSDQIRFALLADPLQRSAVWKRELSVWPPMAQSA